jgi:hypothetical protein
MELAELIEKFEQGPRLLQEAVAGLEEEQLLVRPVSGKWSTLEVVCHLTDFEIVGADRIKRVIAEHEPFLPSGDENAFAARLAYHHRKVEEELLLIRTLRSGVARILRVLKPEDLERRGIHSTEGPLTLRTLVERRVAHIPHHIKFIEEKRRLLELRPITRN